MPPSLIVFDLDGTLIDSAADLAAGVNAMLAGFGRAPLSVADVRQMIGDGVAMLVTRALAARGCEPTDSARALQVFMRHYESGATSLTTAFPGAIEALQALRAAAIPLAVCTNKPARLSAEVLEGLGLARFFARVIGGDSLPFRKPDPRVLLSLLEGFDVRPERSLLVGDSEVDAATARAAGVPFVLMKHGYRRGPAEEILCIAALESFGELPELVHVPPR
ncbi:MAG: phosphoglycolate phosphatase [Proteobacteria bacterium]|nr:phosphoglycolate phosphatase [Pseudomonadota bacterium]